MSSPDTTLNSGAASPERAELTLPLPQPEMDPDALRSDLRDFIQELRETQRERVRTRKRGDEGRRRLLGRGHYRGFTADFQDDAKCRIGVLERELEETMGDRDSAQCRLTQLQSAFQEYQEGECLGSF